jgi:hypothetical protein
MVRLLKMVSFQFAILNYQRVTWNNIRSAFGFCNRLDAMTMTHCIWDFTALSPKVDGCEILHQLIGSESHYL